MFKGLKSKYKFNVDCCELFFFSHENLLLLIPAHFTQLAITGKVKLGQLVHLYKAFQLLFYTVN